ncbi:MULTISPECIES: hypothetical protein [unclassified Bradyrhizobium]|uniref:hypothetical protein n=1 Tax=unclassified Bradyrhizobium TaxID=2631580 RepID=UPI001404AC94|nr:MULTISPECIES: hypothetical protein [unclassified Bradyrhizobium]
MNLSAALKTSMTFSSPKRRLSQQERQDQLLVARQKKKERRLLKILAQIEARRALGL